MLRISDHALLRYYERVAGVDIEALRAQLMEQLARGAGAARAVHAERYVIRCSDAGYVVVGGVVVTVLAHRMGSESLVERAHGEKA